VTDLPAVQFCVLADGREMAWREWGSGKPLIMLHGWSMSSVVFNEVASQLADNFRVLCPDLPGHGQSDTLADCCLTELAESVIEWADLLGIHRADLLGWSLGGQVALQIAADAHLSVTKLLLVATTPRFCQTDDWPHGLPVTQVRALDRNLGRAYEKTMGDFFNLQFVDEDLPQERYRQILAFAVRTGTLPITDVARECLQVLSRADLRLLLAKVNQATLVIHGELDQIIPVSAGEYLAAHLPHAQLYRIPKVGHAPFFSRLDECLTKWQDFLSDDS
jgi:pimeloyl-[acyl-carrier protein] methyl ester esterase